MQVFGNLDLLHKEIEKEYAQRLEAFKKEATQEFEVEKESILKKHKEDLALTKQNLENDNKKVFQTTLSEEKLNAKKEFEQKRESLIDEVFQTAKGRSEDILAKKEYISKIKKFIKGKEDIQIIGSLESYKKDFPDMEVDSKIKGIVVKQGSHIYDFSYTTFIESRKLELRHKICQILFEDVS